MLALLAVITVAAAQPAPAAVQRLLPDARSVLIEANRAPGACKSAGRLQTSEAEPVLLLRPEDRAKRYAYRLTDLPPGQRCLVEDAGGPTSGGK